MNQLKVVIWQNLKSKYDWYIGYVKEVREEGFLVDNLHSVVSDADILFHEISLWGTFLPTFIILFLTHHITNYYYTM